MTSETFLAGTASASENALKKLINSKEIYWNSSTWKVV